MPRIYGQILTLKREAQTEKGQPTLRLRRGVSALFLALALVAGAAVLPATAQTPAARATAEASGPKDYWQERYRDLVNRAKKLRQEIEKERELYADANRRNYRRGDKRHRHRLKLVEAEEKLNTVEAELATIKDDGRRAGALPGWFYEVEDELGPNGGGSAAERGPGDGGRNPRFEEDES
ncbi:MAG: hypothetical protein AB8G23_12745 [Myxococcota bacterium]